MDRALALEHLRLALGDHGSLPSPQELANLIATAEVSLFRGEVALDQRLFDTAWYLHSVASALPSLDLYGPDRQRAAFQVSGHLFDLILHQTGGLTGSARLRAIFAAQVAYFRGDLNPNAIAAYKLREEAFSVRSFDDPELALQLGSAILAFDTGWLFPATARARETRAAAEALWEFPIARSILGSASLVVDGVSALLRYLVYGDRETLVRAQRLFDEAIVNPPSREDLDARWVAFHLRQLSDMLGQSSLWAVLPPDTAPSITRAFTMAQPAVLTLWPPQVDLLSRGDGPNVFDPHVRRMVWSIPTSAGKTLLAQVLIADHLVRGGGGVCFVAPTRSLCREVERNLRRRLRLLAATSEISFLDVVFEIPLTDETSVEVMTPERLAFLLRSDADAVLARFGLFVIDEAHSITDGARGWTLESSLATLHQLTRETNHRLVAMSAALGNRANLVRWLDPDGAGIDFSSEWRGPRRVHAIYTSEPDWDHPTEVPRPLVTSPHRLAYDTFGKLRIRPTPTGRVHELATTRPTGRLVLRQPQRTRVDDLSTPFYKTLAPIAEILARAGPVLVITSTKAEAMNLAAEIAETRAAGDVPTWLVDVAVARLGAAHPLVGALRVRVAYHHGSLPSDVLLAIEESMSSGLLDIVVATTTLTEGVNLPVRTVIIASQGAFTGGGTYDEYITGARLLNAIGRAGRAAQESEGWVVLARNASFALNDFDRLRPSEQDMPVRSVLASDKALEQLARLEEALADGADIARARPGDLLENFIAYVWFAASLGEQQVADRAQVMHQIEATLAWHQLEPPARERFDEIVRLAVRRYNTTDGTSRRRWSRAGTSLPSAAVIEAIARAINDQLLTGEDPQDLVGRLEATRALGQLLALPEAGLPKLRARRGGAVRYVEPDPVALLRDWMRGRAISDLAADHLAEIADDEFRIEQLSDYVTAAFENFLPWALGLVIEWVNQIRSAADLELLPTGLPAYVRYGVSSDVAVELIRKGVSSRAIASAVARDYLRERRDEEVRVREWLAGMTVAEWRERYAPTPADFRMLLDFTRSPETRLAARVLQGDPMAITVRQLRDVEGRLPAKLLAERGPGIGHLAVQAHDSVVGHVGTEHHAEVQALIDTGLPLATEVEQAGERLLLHISLLGQT